MNQQDQKNPTSLSKKELRIAYHFWRRYYKCVEADEAVAQYLDPGILSHHVYCPRPWKPHSGWLLRARKALFLSSNEIAKRMGISNSAYLQLEQNEENRCIQIGRLAEAAEAMGCELVYAIRPKTRQLFSEVIWSQILPHALQDPRLTRCLQHMKPQALAAAARERMKKSAFRQSKNWTRKISDGVVKGSR